MQSGEGAPHLLPFFSLQGRCFLGLLLFVCVALMLLCFMRWDR